MRHTEENPRRAASHAKCAPDTPAPTTQTRSGRDLESHTRFVVEFQWDAYLSLESLSSMWQFDGDGSAVANAITADSASHIAGILLKMTSW